MIRQSVAGVIAALAMAAAAQAQPPGGAIQPQAVSNDQAIITMVATCESQMKRLAGLNKTLAANYNAQRVHEDCLARANSGTP